MIAEIVVPRNVTAITSVEHKVSVWKLAILYANRYATTIDGTTINNNALTGVPVLFTSATFSGSRRSNAAAKITRVEERNTVPLQPNHQRLINAMTMNWTSLLVVI